MFNLDPLRFLHPVLSVSELGKKPKRVRVGDHAIVLFRDAIGRPAAIEDRCAHRFARLSGGMVKGGRLHCPYHGWNFAPDGTGKCPSQPDLKVSDVRRFHVAEHHDYLWLANTDSAHSQVQLATPDYRFLGAFSVLFPAPVHVVLANFSEDEHLPYVHNNLGWNEECWPQVQFKAENFHDRTEVEYRAPQKRSITAVSMGLRAGDLFHNNWTTRFDPLCATFDLHWTDSTGTVTRDLILRSPIYLVPEGKFETRLHVFSFAKARSGAKLWLLPLLSNLLLRSGKNEILADAKFMRYIAETPFEMNGMSLGRFDKPIVHNQKLLRRIYFGQSDSADDLQVKNEILNRDMGTPLRSPHD